MDRYARRGSSALRRAMVEYYLRHSEQDEEDAEPARPQWVPVNVFETENDVVIVAPMPGVESENIDVEVLGNTVTLRAGLRGPAQAERRYLIHEWTYGPYERRVELPIEVDAAAANASHDNGVLVLSLPKARGPRAVKIQLNHAGSGEARHRGHSGHGVASEGIEE